MIADNLPGELYQAGIREASRWLGGRGGAIDGRQASMVSYLTAILHGSVPSSQISPRDLKELRTLAEAIDNLDQGHLPQVGDLLMQRFKGVESKVISGSWTLSNQLELVDKSFTGLTSLEERSLSSKAMVQERKVEDASKGDRARSRDRSER